MLVVISIVGFQIGISKINQEQYYLWTVDNTEYSWLKVRPGSQLGHENIVAFMKEGDEIILNDVIFIANSSDFYKWSFPVGSIVNGTFSNFNFNIGVDETLQVVSKESIIIAGFSLNEAFEHIWPAIIIGIIAGVYLGRYFKRKSEVILE